MNLWKRNLLRTLPWLAILPGYTLLWQYGGWELALGVYLTIIGHMAAEYFEKFIKQNPNG